MNKKSRVTAAVLAFLLGGLGIHRFYLGQTMKAILYLVFLLDFYSWDNCFCRFYSFGLYNQMKNLMLSTTT